MVPTEAAALSPDDVHHLLCVSSIAGKQGAELQEQFVAQIAVRLCTEARGAGQVAQLTAGTAVSARRDSHQTLSLKSKAVWDMSSAQEIDRTTCLAFGQRVSL